MAEIIEMPKLSDTMTVGTLVKWLKKEGDKVASGDMLCEVETDKATMEVENFVSGVLLKQYIAAGGQIPVGAPMCAIGNAGETAPPAPAGATPRPRPLKLTPPPLPKKMRRNPPRPRLLRLLFPSRAQARLQHRAIGSRLRRWPKNSRLKKVSP